MPRDHNPTKTFREIAKEKAYNQAWYKNEAERKKRSGYLAQVQRTYAAGGKHRTVEGYEKAKEGSAAKKLARLHQRHQKQKDEFEATIPGDAAHGFFGMESPPPSPPLTPQGGTAPILKRTMTPLTLNPKTKTHAGGKPKKEIEAQIRYATSELRKIKKAQVKNPQYITEKRELIKELRNRNDPRDNDDLAREEMSLEYLTGDRMADWDAATLVWTKHLKTYVNELAALKHGGPRQAAGGAKGKGKTKAKTRSQAKKKKAIAAAIIISDSDDESGGMPTGPGGGGKKPPPDGGGPKKGPATPPKKKKKKSGSETDSDSEVFYDADVPDPGPSVPNIMGQDEKDEKDPNDLPKAKKHSGVMQGFANMYTERTLKAMLDDPGVMASEFKKSNLTAPKLQLRAIKLIQKRHNKLKLARNKDHVAGVSADYDKIVVNKSAHELLKFIQDPDEDVPDVHIPGLIAAAKRRIKQLKPRTGSITLPTTRVEPPKKKPVKVKRTLAEFRAIQKFKKAQKKLRKSEKKILRRRTKKNTSQAAEYRAHVAASARRLEEERKKNQKVKTKPKSRGFTQGGIKEAKLQIRQQGPGTYSVRATGMTAQVQKHIKLLLSRLSGQLLVDTKAMSKKTAFGYIVKQLTARKTVQVKIVQ